MVLRVSRFLGVVVAIVASPAVGLAEPQIAVVSAAQPADAAKPKAPEASAAAAITAPAATTAVAPVPSRPAITLQAKVDLTRQTMTVAEGNRTIATWVISSGVEDHATPRGVFQPEWTAKMWYSRTYDNAPMPHAVFFKNGAAVHATQSIGALGRAASHGCVRLAPQNAETFYKLVQKHGLVHTRIAVFGTPTYSRPLVAQRPVVRPQRVAAVAVQQRTDNGLLSGLFSNPAPAPVYASSGPFAPPARAYYRPLRSY